MGESQVRRLVGSVRVEGSDIEELMTPVFGFCRYQLGLSQIKADLCDSPVASRLLVQLLVPSAKYEGDCREIDLHGNRFGTQELNLQVNSRQTTYQTQYTVMTNDNYLLTFTLVYFDTESKITLENVMQSLQFY